MTSRSRSHLRLAERARRSRRSGRSGRAPHGHVYHSTVVQLGCAVAEHLRARCVHALIHHRPGRRSRQDLGAHGDHDKDAGPREVSCHSFSDGAGDPPSHSSRVITPFLMRISARRLIPSVRPATGGTATGGRGGLMDRPSTLNDGENRIV